MMQSKASEEILSKLIALIQQLNNEEYGLPLPVLSDNSLGKHIRHIIEFYQCLLAGESLGIVDYEKRARNLNLEMDKVHAESVLYVMLDQINRHPEDKDLWLVVRFDEQLPADYVRTSFSRELVYNIEHAIHHMALIRIGVILHFPHIRLEENFGVAYSTVKYQKAQCAQ